MTRKPLDLHPFDLPIEGELSISLDDPRLKLPRYSDRGWIMVEVLSLHDGTTTWTNREYEVIDYDRSSSVFWIEEGAGIDHWLNKYCEFMKVGTYVIEGITGSVYTDYFGEVDEDWYYETIRRATWLELWSGCHRKLIFRRMLGSVKKWYFG